MKSSNINKIFGYIEGYYGKLLNWNDRKLIVEKLSKNNMNYYFYAPKEDPYHRFDWKKNYPKKYSKYFKDFTKYANLNNVQLMVGISPGLNFKFNFSELECTKKKSSLSRDLTVLIKKFKFFLKLGINEIVLMLDDIPDDFSKKFKDKKEGKYHALLANKISKILKKNILVVPRVYADEISNNDDDYLKHFIKTLDSKIKIFYCGNTIVQDKIFTKIKIMKSLINSEKTIIWDNFYANDYCPRRLFVGPWKNRNKFKNILINGTGMLNTDLLILDIVKKCQFSKKPHEIWKKVLLDNSIPKAFFKISKAFEKPNFSNNNDFYSFKTNKNTLSEFDRLLWNWKSELSIEWYPYLLSFKQDLLILNNKISLNRILKTQSIFLQKKLIKGG